MKEITIVFHTIGGGGEGVVTSRLLMSENLCPLEAVLFCISTPFQDILLKFNIVPDQSLAYLFYFKVRGVRVTFLSGQDKKYLFRFHVVRDCAAISGISFLSLNQPNFIKGTFVIHSCISLLSLPLTQRCLRRLQL